MKRAMFVGVFCALVVPSLAAAESRKRPAHRTASIAPSRHASTVRTWHATDGSLAPMDVDGKPLLVLVQLNARPDALTRRTTLRSLTPLGSFSTAQQREAEEFLRDPRSGHGHAIHPRLLSLLYRIQVHFDAPEIRIVSCYRSGRSRSNHARGRAVDFVVPGVPNERVAAFARRFGFVGVGVYPTSGFLHLDVRTQSYFWLDTSGPGRRNRERAILADLARESDRMARERGERPLDVGYSARTVTLEEDTLAEGDEH